MTVGDFVEHGADSYPPCQFYSLSPSEHPLPTCLENLCQKDINIGYKGRFSPALFLSEGKKYNVKIFQMR